MYCLEIINKFQSAQVLAVLKLVLATAHANKIEFGTFLLNILLDQRHASEADAI